MGTLTVRENLMFSANLRLPKVISQKEKEKKVEDTLYELGLQSCADSKVTNIRNFLHSVTLSAFSFVVLHKVC